MGSGDAPPSSAKASKAAPPPPPPSLPPPPATSSSQETHTPTSWPQGYYPPPPAPGGAPQAGYFPVWHGQHMQPMMYGHYAMYPHGGYPYGLAGMASPPGSGNDAAEGKSSKSKKRKTKPEAAVDKAIAPRTEESDSDGSPSGNSDEDKTENKKNSSEQGTETTNGFQYTGVDFWNGGQGKQRASGAIVPAGALESDMMLQDERELKRQRRKQSNRESARRSRQRKQKECEELSHKVEDLTQDNERLKAQLADVQEIKRQLEEERDSYLEQLQALQQHGDSPKAAELHKGKQRDQQGSSSPIVQNNQQQHLPEIG